MPIDAQKKEIDGYGFTVSQLPGMRGVKVFTKLTRLLSGAKQALAAKSDDEKAGALLGLLEKLEPEDVEYFLTELLTPALVKVPAGVGLPALEGKEVQVMPHFDALFQGRIDLALRALVFALQVNYGGFLKGLAKSVAAQAGAAAAAQTGSIAPPSPTT